MSQRIVTDLDERARLKHTRGRKPVDLVIHEKFPQTRDAIWTAIRKLRRFTKLDLEAATRVNMDTLASYLQGLTKAGYLTRTDRGFAAPSTWTLERDVGVEAPRVTRAGKPVTQGLGRERMWHAMRILKDFSLSELVSTASAGGKAVSPQEAQYYIKHLHHARYLKFTVKNASHRAARWMLIPVRNTGPRAPMIQSIRVVFDPNLGQVVTPPEKTGD